MAKYNEKRGRSCPFKKRSPLFPEQHGNQRNRRSAPAKPDSNGANSNSKGSGRNFNKNKNQGQHHGGSSSSHANRPPQLQRTIGLIFTERLRVTMKEQTTPSKPTTPFQIALGLHYGSSSSSKRPVSPPRQEQQDV